MRHGLIIEENSPQHMFAKYQTDSLETCFFKACYNKRNNKVDILIEFIEFITIIL